MILIARVASAIVIPQLWAKCFREAFVSYDEWLKLYMTRGINDRAEDDADRQRKATQRFEWKEYQC